MGISDTEFTHDLEAMRDMNREEPVNTYEKPDQIPIKGYVQTEIKPKAPPESVKGNTDAQIKKDYDEDGVRRIGLTIDEKVDALNKESDLGDAEFRATHPFFAHIAKWWWAYIPPAAVGILKACGKI